MAERVSTGSDEFALRLRLMLESSDSAKLDALFTNIPSGDFDPAYWQSLKDARQAETTAKAGPAIDSKSGVESSTETQVPDTLNETTLPKKKKRYRSPPARKILDQFDDDYDGDLAGVPLESNSWRSERLCNGHETLLEDPVYASAVKDSCYNKCPVRRDCLKDDITSSIGPANGIRAGLDFAKRKMLRRDYLAMIATKQGS
jgi:hypothetical protein